MKLRKAGPGRSRSIFLRKSVYSSSKWYHINTPNSRYLFTWSEWHWTCCQQYSQFFIFYWSPWKIVIFVILPKHSWNNWLLTAQMPAARACRSNSFRSNCSHSWITANRLGADRDTCPPNTILSTEKNLYYLSMIWYRSTIVSVHFFY